MFLSWILFRFCFCVGSHTCWFQKSPKFNINCIGRCKNLNSERFRNILKFRDPYAFQVQTYPCSRKKSFPQISPFPLQFFFFLSRIEFLLGPCALLALVLNHEFSTMEILWTFSIYLESVAILPQVPSGPM